MASASSRCRGTDHSHMHIAPAAGRGQIAAALVLDRVHLALIDDVHAAEVADLVVDDDQLAMVALVEELEEPEPPKGLAQRVERVYFAAGVAQRLEQSLRA